MEMTKAEFFEYVCYDINCEECEYNELEDCNLQCIDDIKIVD